ncbi:putative mucin/carbohydrate-binding domain-containing protein [Listeria booriae]|nr:putative mucin/carbohydrate-binding domain-containing protein [Listeria booriae]
MLGNIRAEAGEINSKEIFSIEEPTWIFKSGMGRGKYHDRQDLGFILKENTKLKVRQINTNFKGSLTVRLLGDDSKVEKSVTVSSNWTTIEAGKALVPFVDTPYGEIGATLEYEVDSDVEQKPLPVYRQGGNQAAFFATWDNNDGDYGLIINKDFQLLIPKKDKNLARNLKGFPNLDAFIDYYNGIFKLNNDMAGLDNSSPTNRTAKNRYFLKADANGAGGAYYGSNWTAQSSNTVGMWLTKGSWGALHEIAHGYQTSLDNRGMYTGEVSNNLFGAQYEYDTYGRDEADRIGWMFGIGYKTQIENNLYTKMVKNFGTYGSVGLREQLILLALLKQKAGNEAFTKLYQGYRADANKASFNISQYTLPNAFNHYYSEHSGLDFTAVLERWGIKLTDNQPVINRAREYTPVASLADVVPENKLLDARLLVDPNVTIRSNFTMVTNEEIAPLNLTGSLNIELDTENIQDLKGTKIQIKNGKKVVQEQFIQGKQVTFENLPNGVYTVNFIGDVMKDYSVKQHYVYVKEAQNQAKILVEDTSKTDLTNQKIKFLGLGNVQFAEFNTDLSKEQGVLSISAKDPHAYFGQNLYAAIEIKDTQGNVVYQNRMAGVGVKTGTFEFPLKEGYQIQIEHVEPSRLASVEPISVRDRINTWTMSKWGLVNHQLQNDAQQDLIKKINAYGDALIQDNNLKDTALIYLPQKKNLLQAIHLLDEKNKKEYLDKYKALFDELNYGDNFKFTFQGLGNTVFATMNLSTKEQRLTVNTNKATPHVYFAERYATILVQGADGAKKYVKNYWGKKGYAASVDKVDLSLGDYITVIHEEGAGHRLIIQNTDSQKRLPNQKTVRYQLAQEGLKVVAEADVPKLVQDSPEVTSLLREGDTSIHGKATPGASVEVWIGNATSAKTVKADDLGEWKVTVPALMRGEIVRVISTYDGVRLVSPTYKVIVMPTIQSWLGVGETRMNGTAAPKATIDVLVNGVKKATVSADAAGNWEATVPALTLKQTVQLRATIDGDSTDSEIYHVDPMNLGDNFKFTFQGLGNAIFATMDLSTKEQRLTVNTNKATPHVYFAERYATILVQGADGAKKYVKNYWGKKGYAASVDKVDLSLGDYITVIHEEGAGHRLIIQNTGSQKRLPNQKIVRYQLVKDGIKVVAEADVPKLVQDSPEVTSLLREGDTSIQGKATPGASVEVLVGNTTPTKTVKADDLGEWKVTVSALIRGEIVYATSTYAGEQLTSPTYKVMAIPTIQSWLGIGETRINGQATPGATIDVLVNGVKKATVFADDSGSWEATVPALTLKQTVQLRATIENRYEDSEIYHVDPTNYGDNFKFTFQGLGNAVFATMDLSTKEQRLTVNTNKATPHVYFAERYATILVQGADGAKKYVKNYWGNKGYAASVDKVNLSLGDYITVIHEEGAGHRLIIQNTGSQKRLPNQKTVRYQLAQDGIKVVAEADVPKLVQDPPKVTSSVREGATSIQGKATPGASVEVLVGNATPTKAVKANDLGEWTVAISALVKGELVRVKSTSEGVQLVSPEYKVTALPTIQSWLGIGETRINGQATPGATIDVLVNGVKKVTVSADASGSWAATVPALTLGQTVQIRETTEDSSAASKIHQVDPIHYGDKFKFNLQGLCDITFATMDFSTKERLLTVNTIRTMPHWYFTERYATVLVQGTDGTKKYLKNYWGRKDYAASIDKVNLSLGDYITVIHEEGAGHRLIIQNTESQKRLPNQKIVRYQLVKEGLKVVAEADVPKLVQDPPKVTSFVREGATSIQGKATPGASVEVLVGNAIPTKTVKADDLGEWTVTVSALVKGETVRVKSTSEGVQLVSPEYKVTALPSK